MWSMWLQIYVYSWCCCWTRCRCLATFYFSAFSSSSSSASSESSCGPDCSAIAASSIFRQTSPPPGRFHASWTLRIEELSYRIDNYLLLNSNLCSHVISHIPSPPIHDRWLVGWLSGRTSVSDRRTFTGLHRTCSWWVTIYMGKPSDVGQPTRPTQPFILTGSTNE